MGIYLSVPVWLLLPDPYADLGRRWGASGGAALCWADTAVLGKRLSTFSEVMVSEGITSEGILPDQRRAEKTSKLHCQPYPVRSVQALIGTETRAFGFRFQFQHFRFWSSPLKPPCLLNSCGFLSSSPHSPHLSLPSSWDSRCALTCLVPALFLNTSKALLQMSELGDGIWETFIIVGFL